jgi:peptide/nickel transport system permease protein
VTVQPLPMRWHSPTRRLWVRFFRNRVAVTGAVIILFLLLVAACAAILPLRDPASQVLSMRLAPPSARYWLGTDELGRDVLSRLVFGARVDLGVATSSVLVGVAVAILLGTSAAYYGGVVDDVLMRLLDVLLAFPYLLLGIVAVSALGVGTSSTILAVGLWTVPTIARVIRGLVLRIHTEEFIEACRAIGATPFRIMFRHILPNCIPVLLIYSTLYMANAILLEAGLSFLGLGVKPPTASWGLMISTGRSYLLQAPSVTISAGCAISLAVLGFNLFADGLRDVLDIKLSA